MDHALHAPTRIAIVAALHFLLVPLAFVRWAVGSHYDGVAYFPGHDFLFMGTASGVCLVLLFPIFLRGRPIQRVVASALSVLPGVLFVIVVYYAIRINVPVRG